VQSPFILEPTRGTAMSYEALVVLECLLTSGLEDVPCEFLADMRAMHNLRSFNYVDNKGFN
jgi:epsin